MQIFSTMAWRWFADHKWRQVAQAQKGDSAYISHKHPEVLRAFVLRKQHRTRKTAPR